MLERPVIELVNELHWLGRRLAALKRLYQSYELIMRRVLQRQRLLRDEARSSQPGPLSFGATFGDIEFADMRQSSLMSTSSGPGMAEKPVGVHLSSAAVARFERLVDRINLYCLSEIESCLSDKESLTFLVGDPDFVVPLIMRHSTLTAAELQLDRAQGFASGGKADSDHDLAGQSDDIIPARQSHDCILFNRAPGRQRRVHQGGLLGEFWRDHVRIDCGVVDLRVCQRYCRGQNHLSVPGADLFSNVPAEDVSWDKQLNDAY